MPTKLNEECIPNNKQETNAPIVTHLKQTDENPLSKLNQCSDTTFKNRVANNQKQPVWTGLKNTKSASTYYVAKKTKYLRINQTLQPLKKVF